MNDNDDASGREPAQARARPLGREPVNGTWTAPPGTVLAGAHTRLEPVDAGRHASALFESVRGAPDALWDHMPYGPFGDEAAFAAWLATCEGGADPMFYAVHDGADGPPAGMASFMRIAPAHATIEIGHIWFAPRLQRTVAATEAIYLMMRHALEELAYRRLEWKCNALNERSRRAALRLGFRFEGIFHQHLIVKGRNRDTAWYSLLDGEWPAASDAFERWLAPENFDSSGRQRSALGAPPP